MSLTQGFVYFIIKNTLVLEPEYLNLKVQNPENFVLEQKYEYDA